MLLVTADFLERNPEHWCKVSEAKTKRGVSVKPTSEDAWRFCAYGALKNVCDENDVEFSVITRFSGTLILSQNQLCSPPVQLHVSIRERLRATLHGIHVDASQLALGGSHEGKTSSSRVRRRAHQRE